MVFNKFDTRGRGLSYRVRKVYSGRLASSTGQPALYSKGLPFTLCKSDVR